MSALLRILAFLMALPLLSAGCAGLGLSMMGPEVLGELQAELEAAIEQQAEQQDVPAAQLAELQDSFEMLFDEVEEALALTPLWGGLVAVGGGLVAFAVWPRKRGAKRKKDKKAENKGADAPGDKAEKSVLSQVEAEAAPKISKKDRKKHLKAAGELEAERGAEEAGGYLLERGLADEALEVFVRDELWHRAAEIRNDQNRFEEAADLYQKAGKHEAAASIYAQLENFDGAAKCYVEADKLSVAGEMYERAENFREAGRCYREIGFHRHAANAFLQSGAKGDAATSLVEAFTDEGGGSQAENESKTRELRSLAKKAGELLVELERFEEAENILVRAGAFGPAAKVAYTVGAYERAADLFLRVGRGDLAAKALKKAGDDKAASRHLGEYLRDKGDIEAAVEHLATAEEHSAAGDLYRRLERYSESGECYASAMDYPAAAEMFRVAAAPGRAAECFEKAGDFDASAEAWADAGDWSRHAELLERASKPYEAGSIYAKNERPDEAIRLLQSVEADNPSYGDACSLLGQLFEQKGMDSLSIKKYEEAAGDGAVTRANVESYYRLARAHENKSSWAEAVDGYEKILSFDYHHEDVAQRLEHAKEEAAKVETAMSQTGPTAPVGAQPTTPTLNAAAPTTRYEIARELGRGGMGVVYLARDTVLDRDVAYKVLPEGLRGNPNALKNFLREAKAAAQLNHPNIVTVYDAGESEHGFYMAMEFVDGTTLKEIVRARGAVAPGGVLYILRQMTEALSFAHTKKVVHRDIKTANTMWTRDKQVKIMDFGLAKLMEEVRNATTLISGTPFYMSPEQTLGQNIDHRTDIYSLGVTVFELATGVLPFRKGNVPYHHVHTAPPDPVEVNAQIPPALGAVILRCLEKDPAKRFQSAKDLLAEIDRLTAAS